MSLDITTQLARLDTFIHDWQSVVPPKHVDMHLWFDFNSTNSDEWKMIKEAPHSEVLKALRCLREMIATDTLPDDDD